MLLSSVKVFIIILIPNSTTIHSHNNNCTLHLLWNLDFFRYIIPSFCASDQLTPNQVISLVAFYPLLLIVTNYVCVELYARDCRLIVWLWRPFSRCLAFVLRGREIRFSFVHAFCSSFLLLSYSVCINPVVVSNKTL